MFETKEQYEAALGQLQTPEERENFIKQYGSGQDLPTEAEKAVTRVITEEEAAQPMIPVTEDSPIPDFIPEEAEPATEEEINQYAVYKKEEEDAIHQGELDRLIEQRKIETALLDDEGNPLVDQLTGEYLQRDLSNAELIDNSVRNMANDVQSQLANISIGTGEIYRNLFGEEAIEEWVNNPEISDFWKAGLREEDFVEALRSREIADAGRRQVGSITDGDIVAGIANGITSVGSSAFVNAVTFGGGLPVQFTGQFYTDFNKTLAEEKGKTIEELREDGEDNFWAPAAFGALAGMAEKFGLEGVGSKVAGYVGGKAAGKLATRLFNGLGEGTTELIQTGLEAANEAKARNEDVSQAFVDGVFSKDGLEAFLQGAVGGGVVSGAGQNHRQNLKKVRAAASALRSSTDAQAIEDLMAQESDLRATMQTTSSPEVRQQLQDQIKSIQDKMKGHVVAANGIVRKMTDKQIDKAVSIKEAAQAFASVNKDLINQFQNGDITQKEYDSAREALKDKLQKKREELSVLVSKVEEQPNIREKDLVSPNATGLWNTSVKNKINEVIGSKGAEGAWDIIQDNDFKNFLGAKIKTAWNKIPTDIQGTTTLNDVINEVMYGGTVPQSQTVLGTFKAYKQEGKAAPASYFLGNIDNKILGAIQSLTQQETAQGTKGGRVSGTAIQVEGIDENTGRGPQIADESAAIENTIESAPRRSLTQQAERLGVGAKAADDIKSTMETLVADGEINPADKKFESKYVDRFRKHVLPIVKKQLGRKRDEFKNYLDQNAAELIGIYPKRTLAKKRNDPAQAWAERTPSVEEFVDYHYPTKPGDKEVEVERGVIFDDQGNEREVYKETEGNRIFESAGNWELGKETVLQPNEEYEFTNGVSVANEPVLDEALMAKRKTRLAEAISEGLGFRAMEDTIAEQQETSTRDNINAGFDKIIETLRSLQGERGTLQSNPLAIAPAALETAVRATKAAFNAGMDLAQAIEKGYEKIADQVDLAAFRKYIAGEINKIKNVNSWAQQQEQVAQQEQQEAAATVQESVDPEASYINWSPSEKGVFEDYDNASKFSKLWEQKMKDAGVEGNIVVVSDSDKRKNDVQEFREWTMNVLPKYFPKQFFVKANQFTRGTQQASDIGKRGTAFNQHEMDTFIESDAKFTELNVPNPPRWNEPYGEVKLTHTNAFKMWQEKKSMMDNNQRVMEYFGYAMEKMIQDDPSNMRFIPALIGMGSDNQGSVIRAGAPFRGASIDFQTERDGVKLKPGQIKTAEHTLPRALVGRYMMMAAANGQMKPAIKNVKRNFFQIVLDDRDDRKLKGDGFNYTANMPKGWTMEDSVWARYFNDDVNNNNGGIDPNGIFLFEEGKTVAEKFGAIPKAPAGKRNAAGGFEFDGGMGKRVGAEFRFNNARKTWRSAPWAVDRKGNVYPGIVKAQQEVVAEKVGDQFEQFMDKAIGALEGVVKNDGVLQANIAAVPVHVLVGGLRAAKLAYRGARNLAQAIEAGYQVVKDFMTRQEWADFTSKAIKEVNNTATGATIGLQFATENAIKLQQQADLNGKFNEIIEQKTKGKIKADQVFSKGDIGKPKGLGLLRSFFNHPSAEDLNGLLYTIIPSGKQGEQALQFFKENIIIPYQRGVTQMNAYKANLHEGFNLSSKLMSNRKLNKVVPGTTHTWNNAIRVALAAKNGQELKGINQETADALISAVNADPKAAAYLNKINELFDGTFEWNAKDINRPIGGELAGMADKVKRKEFISDYLNNAEQVFSEENLNKIEATAGKAVRENLEKTLARMKSGKNRTISQDSSTNKLLNWVNNAQAMIMFTNMRSAALQTLSMFNYINTGGNNIFRAAGNLANVKQYRDDVKMLWNSDYLRGRRGNMGFDIAADEIADAASSAEGLSTLLDKVRQLGFKPTQLMDSFAISRGGALYYRTRLDKYTKEGHPNPEQAAMDDFIYLTEESQQSADPSRISQIQAGPLGRIVFAFGNTPFQYARVMKRAVSDLANGRGNPVNNLARISYYTGIQAMLFNTLQQALWMGDDEEDKEERKQWAITGAIQSWFKSLGLGGAAVSTGIAIAQEIPKGHRADYLKAATSFSPPISAKLRQLGQAGKAIEKGDPLEATTKGAEALFNVPTDRLMTKFNNLQDVVSGDLDGMQMLMKTLGWSDYSLGIDNDTTGRSPRRVRRRERPRRERRSPARRLESPLYALKAGEAGQAHKDGTIEVDPNLSPEEKRKTIAHEKQHVKDMKENGLDYDDNNVYWKGKSFARNNGKIKDGDTWKKEGDPSLPWEKRAYAAENGSPIKKDKPKPGTPEWDKYVKEGVEFNQNWYNEPGTRAMLEEQAPRFQGKVDKYLDRMEEVHFDHAPHLEAGEVAEFYRNNYADESKGEHKFNVGIGPDHSVDRPGLVAHELSHAAGWDYDLGKKVLDVTGGPDKSTRYGRYLSSPDEAYGNLQELRHILDLKPTQRDLTPDQLQKLIDEKGNDDVKAYVKAFGLENVAKAHNQVAATDKKPKKRSLEDLYNNKQDDYYV